MTWPRLQNMALFDEILSGHEQKVRCASVHLFSGVHLQCELDIWFRKYSELIWKINHALSPFNTLPHPFLGVHYHLRQKISSVQLPNSAVWVTPSPKVA